MTQKGKCETCRLRKVKCDEGKPSCGVCRKGHRPCSYQSEGGLGNRGIKLDNVALPLRQIRHVNSSQGTFLTLGPPKALKSFESPSAPLSSNQTQLASRWIRMLCNMPSTSLSIIVPARIGNDFALDAAAEYMCDCHHAFLTKQEDDVRLAHSSGNRAMMSMRKALVLEGANCSDFVLLSISLLLSSQYLIGVQRTNHQIHALALCKLLKQRWIRGHWGSLEELLVRNIVIEETGASILAGTVSEMDDPLRLKARSLISKSQTPPPPITVASSEITDTLIRIPRLVLMVRQLINGQDDSEHTHATIALAKNLFYSPSVLMIEGVIADSSTLSPTPTSSLSITIDYKDEDSYAVAVFHYMTRNLLCSIIQRLADHISTQEITAIPTMPFFDLTAVHTEDVAVAEKIAMSIDYAFTQTPTPPFRAIRISTPMMLSYGAWTRLQRRCEGGEGDAAGLQRAVKMQRVVADAYKRALRVWKIPVLTEEVVEEMNEAYSGGRVMPHMSRKK